MKYKKILQVKSPQRANPTDAGIDFFMPDYTPEFVEQVLEKNKELAYGPHGLVLKQGERCLIPSGIKVDVPSGHALIAFNKSGVAVKKGLDVGACVVDVGYQGQVHISLTNPSKSVALIEHGEKIIQFVLLPVNFANLEEVYTEEQLYPVKSSRGDGGFGSTNMAVNV